MVKIIHSFNHFCENKYFPLLFLPLSAIFLLFYSISTSPLFSFEGLDSAIFQEIGAASFNGKIIYRDIFDNKGPLLYWINGLGLQLGGLNGLFILQIVFQSISFYYIYKIARLFTNGIRAFLTLLLSILYYSVFILEGNQCEEWMLPIICAALYIGLRFFSSTEGKLHFTSTLALGVCFGLAFFIRPNDACGIIGGIAVGLLAFYLYHKRWNESILMIGSFIMGALTVALPVIIFFASNNALSYLFEGLLGINIVYSGGVSNLLNRFLSDSGSWFLLALMATMWIVIANTRLRSTLWILIPSSVFETLLFGTSYFLHYYIVIIPFYAVTFASIFAIGNRSIKSLAFLLVAFLPVSYSYRIVPKKALTLAVHQSKILTGNYEYSYGDILHISESEIKKSMRNLERLASRIPPNERDSVWNYNIIEPNTCDSYFNYVFFPHNKIIQMNRVTYPLRLDMDIDPLKICPPPRWLVADGKNSTRLDSQFTACYAIVDSCKTWAGSVHLYYRR